MSASISLMGWDCVNAVSYSTMNQYVLKSKEFPAGFNYTDGKISISGAWADWKICNGGGQTNIDMQCDIATGTLTDKKKQVKLDGGFVKIQVNLVQVEKTDPEFKDPTGTGNGTGTSLVVNPTGSQGIDPIVVLQTSLDSNEDYKFIIKGIFQEALNAQLNAFVQYFHSVVLNETAARQDYQWLKPTSLSYAAADVSTPDNSTFAALMMVEGDKPVDDHGNPLACEVDGQILDDLPGGANSVVAISAEKFISHVLIIGATRVIPGTTAADYNFIEDDLAITNNKDLSWGNFVLDSGKTVNPAIPANGFRMSVEEDQIKLEFTNVNFTSYRTIGGDVVSINLTQFFKLGVLPKPDGSGYVLDVRNDDQGSDIPNIQMNATVTPNQAEQDFDWAMIGIGAALAILPVGSGLFKLGQGAIQLGSKAINLIKGVDGAAEVAIEMSEMSPLLSQEGVVAADDVEAAGDAAGAEADAASSGAAVSRSGMAMRYITIANKFCAAGGLMTALVGISDPIGKALAQHDVSQLPTLTGFADACVGATSWPNMSNWKLVDVRLAGAFLLYGNMTPDM